MRSSTPCALSAAAGAAENAVSRRATARGAAVAKSDTLGRIECPVCGTAAGMRIAPDKNGEPFGYCDATCSAQLRIGGDKARLARFVARYPWAKPPAAPVTPPAPVPAPGAAKPAPAAAKPAPAPAPTAAPAAAPAAPKKPAGPFDILAQFNRT